MGDTISHGPQGPSREPRRWLVVLGALVVVVAVIAALVVRHSGATDEGAGQRGPVPAERTVALMLPRTEAFGHTVDLRDRTPRDGPWTVVVRRRDGSLGRHGAVVTFPVRAPARGTPVRVDGALGRAHRHAVSWPIAGRHARIRGDLARGDLIGLATRTSIVGGRPRVRPPGGFVVAASGPYRSRHVREAQYSRAEVIAAGKLDGTVVTGVVRGGGFEDRLYATGVVRRVQVHGRPAVVSGVGAGSGSIAWGLAPGIVAFVGYSGVPLDDEAVGLLHRFAAQVQRRGRHGWQSTDPEVVTGSGGFG